MIGNLIFVVLDPILLAGFFALRFVPRFPGDVANDVFRMTFMLFGTAWVLSLCAALGALWMMKLARENGISA